jgi:hypothetical protein
MSWLYTQKSGDGVLIDTHVRFVSGFPPNIAGDTNDAPQYDLLKKWTDYLVENTLHPISL